MVLFGNGRNKKLEDQMFNVKMMIKVLNSNSNKMKNKYRNTVKRIKTLVRQNDEESALILADHAIQQRQLQLRYMRLSLKLDIVSSIIQSSMETQYSTSGISELIDTITCNVDPNSIIDQVERFENLFDDMNVKTQFIEGTLESSTALNTSATSEAKNLISHIKDSVALEGSNSLPDLHIPSSVLNSSLKDKNIL
jgi:charged multivesicular body protein 1